MGRDINLTWTTCKQLFLPRELVPSGKAQRSTTAFSHSFLGLPVSAELPKINDHCMRTVKSTDEFYSRPPEEGSYTGTLSLCSFHFMILLNRDIVPAKPLCLRTPSTTKRMPVPSLPTEVLYMVVDQLTNAINSDAVGDTGHRQ